MCWVWSVHNVCARVCVCVYVCVRGCVRECVCWHFVLGCVSEGAWFVTAGWGRWVVLTQAGVCELSVLWAVLLVSYFRCLEWHTTVCQCHRFFCAGFTNNCHVPVIWHFCQSWDWVQLERFTYLNLSGPMFSYYCKAYFTSHIWSNFYPLSVIQSTELIFKRASSWNKSKSTMSTNHMSHQRHLHTSTAGYTRTGNV